MDEEYLKKLLIKASENPRKRIVSQSAERYFDGEGVK
jgi:hypothetical protein